MKLPHQIHLGYCTNIHRGETWEETFRGLSQYTLAVKSRVSPTQPYGIGLRLSHEAAIELSQPAVLGKFKDWLAANDCYVFTINGFPYGRFHGGRVKEQVFAPDWTTPERLEYTNRLFDLLVEIAPEGAEGSISTLPGSFKEFIEDDSQVEAIVANLLACHRHIEDLRQRTGRDLHLGLEPEPLGLFENSPETVQFFERLHKSADGAAERESLRRNLGMNYDCCHLAVEFETAKEAIQRITGAGIRLSKIHISSALRLQPTEKALARLHAFQDDVYLHQVIIKGSAVSPLTRFRDLAPALRMAEDLPAAVGEEWRVHFHIPLHATPEALFGDTRDHIGGVLEVVGKDPSLCRHFEMETYTWEVLPVEMRSADVVDQLVREYEWTLAEMKRFGLA